MSSPQPAHPGFTTQSLAAMLGDLIATHETQPNPLHGSPHESPVATVQQKPRDTLGPVQRSIFGEIMDFMLAPLLLLADRTKLLSQQISFELTRQGPITSIKAGAEELFARPGEALNYQIIAPDDQTIFGDPSLPRPALYDYPELGKVNFRNVNHRETDLRLAYTYVPVRGEEDLNHPVLVQIAERIDERSDLANRIIKGVIFPQFVILPIAAALVWFGLSRGLRPLRGLRDRIRSRRPDDLSPIDPHSAPQEIAPLVESFNELLSQLQATLATQRRFIADAAHQMKTPLAGIRMQAELALREQEPADRQRSLTQLAHSSERASHLINQLLALARAESLGEKGNFVPLELNALLREVVSELAPMALASRLDLGLDDPGGKVYVMGNPVLLGELLHNLVSNAIHYTPDEGVVNIRLLTAMGAVSIEVEDNGPGIPPAEREVVFERFYRLRDRVASNVGESHGSGLGLAIVREIARLHGAQVAITDGAPWPAGHGRGVGANFVLRMATIAPPTRAL